MAFSLSTLLLLAAVIAVAVRTISRRRQTPVTDASIGQIIETGTLGADEPNDFDEIAEEEDRFWERDSWEPDPWEDSEDF